MFKNAVNFGGAVEDLQKKIAISNSINIVGTNSTGVASNESEDEKLKAPAGIISYEPDELMISVFAGTEIHEVNIELQAAQQRIVIPDWGTIGGAVATRRNGLRETHHQTLPNNVLRCTVIAADGSLYQAGGQVVKNVSGFDLVKLLVGSWGLLGLIVEVTMRTEPLPQVSQWVKSAHPQAREQASKLYRPAVETLIEGVTYLLLEGHQNDVEQQISLLKGFALCEMPSLSHQYQYQNLNFLSQGPVRSIERGIRKQFDPTNKFNKKIAAQRNLLT